uniref:Uncharacterized protein n=1 Tax=Arundo donax TaxID=35708 RepID=A0A0A9BYJ5_ARUDO
MGEECEFCWCCQMDALGNH